MGWRWYWWTVAGSGEAVRALCRKQWRPEWQEWSPDNGGMRAAERDETTFPHYSTVIAAAWEVLDRFAYVEVGRDEKGWYCVLATKADDDLSVHTFSTSVAAPHAIALAALKAVGVEV